MLQFTIHYFLELWLVFRATLSEVDIARVLRMGHITDDASRARAILRQALNDGQLTRLFSAVTSNDGVLL